MTIQQAIKIAYSETDSTDAELREALMVLADYVINLLSMIAEMRHEKEGK
jgi:hypothetical protein